MEQHARIEVGLFVAVLVLTCAPVASASAGSWPNMKPFKRAFRIDTPEKAVVKTLIRDQKGDPQYLFVCRTSNDETVPGVIYAGDLDCRLMEAARGEVETNLLVETHAPNVAAWYSRGRMFAPELQGDCARYPEHGRIRHFRLRGMKITLAFDQVQFAASHPNGSPKLASYTLQLIVDVDPSATTDIAEPSGYLDPSVQRPDDPRSCLVVRKGNQWKDP